MKKKRAALLGTESRKIQPKLRMIANGNSEVNSIRAEHCAALSVSSPQMLKTTFPLRGDVGIPFKEKRLKSLPTKKKLKSLIKNMEVNVFIQTTEKGIKDSRFPGETARKGNILTAKVRLDVLPQLANNPNIAYIEIGQPLSAPLPTQEVGNSSRPGANLRKVGSSHLHHHGKDVLIGIIDVGGFDFAHPDFLDDQGNTRFLQIWDQGGDARPSPTIHPFEYGAEFTQAHMNAAIRSASHVGVPPQELERQSQMKEGSHGTHVASIAAGNHGICREAKIAGVVIGLSDEEMDRRQSFYDSTRLAHAVEYLLHLSEQLDLPISINISLGTNGHAHDGSSAVSRWIDYALSVPGRSICVASGNAGQEVARFEGDTGFVMGRIHTCGKVQAADLTQDIEWVVVGNGVTDLSENEIEIWLSPQDRYAVSLRPPGGDWIGPIEPREFIENQQLEDGSMFSIYNELYHPANGLNYISLYLSPFFSHSVIIGVPAGTWTIRLHGREIRDGQYHGWIERDDPRRLGRIGNKEAWRFPSFFTERSNVDHSSISSLACGHRIVAVANLDAHNDRINITSSQGPTRDGKTKPDVAAPGTKIPAANGFAGSDDLWVSKTGTSMASPYVTGIVGLMLAINPKLTAAQIVGILHRTSQPLPGDDFSWRDDAGFGVINSKASLNEAKLANLKKDVTS